MCFLAKNFMRRHSRFDSNETGDRPSLFSVIADPPGDRLRKVSGGTRPSDARLGLARVPGLLRPKVPSRVGSNPTNTAQEGIYIRNPRRR